MGERFRLVGVTVHDGGAELRLAGTPQTVFRWSLKGDRLLELSEIVEPENDLEAGVRSRFAPEAPESDIQRAIGAVLALQIADAAMCAERWSSFDEFLAWAATLHKSLSSEAEEARGRIYDEHGQNLGNGGIRGCNPHDVPNRRCEAHEWEKLAGEILADARVLAAELDRMVRRG